jgi:hypothetical protein
LEQLKRDTTTGGTMNQQSTSKKPSSDNVKRKLVDMVDLEIMFIHAIAICAFLLAIVAADLLIS